MGPADLTAQLDRVRLESETLYDVIGVIASAPDLDRVLDGVVEVLTKATRCHACFIYLRHAELLRMRAASRVFAHLVGQVEFSVEEGLAGWVARRNTPAFIRENALSDPRTNYIRELEEERFQSMVAVPIPARSGGVMGVIVLHTIAPREFDEGTLNVLANTAPLLAGAIENAQLYEDARRRVAALTALSTLSQQIAAVETREELYRTATRGVRLLVGCDSARLYNLDDERQRLALVAADPPVEDARHATTSGTAILLDLLQRRGGLDSSAARRIGEALELGPAAEHMLVVPVAAGEEHIGVLMAVAALPLPQEADELLRAVANQVAVAVKKAELIERLTEENILRDMFAALEDGRAEDADARARQARYDLERPHVFVEMRRAVELESEPSWHELLERAETGLKRLAPGAACDSGDGRLRALLPLEFASDVLEVDALDEGLRDLGDRLGVAVGRSGVHRGTLRSRDGLHEAADAARVAAALHRAGGALAYAQIGAYRYLVHLAPSDAPRDPYLEAVQVIAQYDRRRGSQLVATLERYLADRRRVTETARALIVHPNTLRQRLERMETLTGLDLATADLLALELAVKLARLRPVVD